MTTWNHRLVSCPSENGGEPWVAFKEVYYNNDKPYGYSNICTGGDDANEAKRLAELLMKAAELPVLHEADFGDTQPLVFGHAGIGKTA